MCQLFPSLQAVFGRCPGGIKDLGGACPKLKSATSDQTHTLGLLQSVLKRQVVGMNKDISKAGGWGFWEARLETLSTVRDAHLLDSVISAT
jgi:hypothetical protein